ncbi:MAG: ribosome maturation factor RimM [Candidatus Nanopelagicaceae bacterium]|nr:ribosome maturation factor RimM [Candidatus Nanopelagicaceae bacterium]
MLLIVGRIGRVHGVRGEVTVEVRTDSPEDRFQVGTKIATDPFKFGPLTITGQRWHNGILLLTFDGVSDRGAAEKIKNVLLMADVDIAESNADEFHVQLLIGCTIELIDGTVLGTIDDVLTTKGQNLLSFMRGGKQVLIPFVKAIVPTVDIAGRKVVVTPPEGLLDEN